MGVADHFGWMRLAFLMEEIGTPSIHCADPCDHQVDAVACVDYAPEKIIFADGKPMYPKARKH